jgi:ADP-ribose pyrophosphatase
MKKITSQRVYQGLIVDVLEAKFQFNDKILNIEQVTHPGGVCVAAKVGDHYLMVKQYRFGVEKPLIEFPAGLIDPGEDPQDSALRELEEETGYRAQSIQSLGSAYLSPGYNNEEIYFYLATDLSYVGVNFDENEDIEIIKCTLDTLNAMELKDAKTLALLHRINHHT